MRTYPADRLIVGDMYFTTQYNSSCFIFVGMDGERYRFTRVFSSIEYTRNSNGFYYFPKTIWWTTKFKYGR